MGEVADCPLLTHLIPVLCLAQVQGGGCTDSISALGYSSKVETMHRQLIKIQCGEDSNEELNFKMLLVKKLVNGNYSPMEKKEILPFAATWMDLESIILSKESQRKTYDITYTWNLKIIQMNLYTNQKWTQRHKKQTCGYQRALGKSEEQIRNIGLIDTLLLICQIDNKD